MAPASRDYPDNPERFAFLSQAALTWAASTGHRYDIVHAHDWQAGLVPLPGRPIGSGLASARRAGNRLHHPQPRVPGCLRRQWLPRLGLGWDLMRVDALEYWNRISFLKGGIMFAGVITTVSPRVRPGNPDTRNSALGSTASCAPRSADLVGILNGIDYDQWDPERGPEPSGALQRVKDGREGGGQAKGSRSIRTAGTPDDASHGRWWR